MTRYHVQNVLRGRYRLTVGVGVVKAQYLERSLFRFRDSERVYLKMRCAACRVFGLNELADSFPSVLTFAEQYASAFARVFRLSVRNKHFGNVTFKYKHKFITAQLIITYIYIIPY